jgi:ATP-binding cassette, subfamily B, bacterial
MSREVVQTRSSSGGKRPGELPPPRTWRERISALRNVPPFIKLIWQTGPALAVVDATLRLILALAPVATLFIAKLILDEVVRLTGLPDRPIGFNGWLASGLLDRLLWLLAAEFSIGIFSDILRRSLNLIETMLSELFSISTSTRLMQHAASLDLEHFEDSELQDKLERARRQVGGNIGVLNQVLTQAQDVVTIVSFAAGIVVLAPWLIALLIIALVPAFLSESYFSAQSYALNYTRTQERREIDYMRHTGASIETAKEVKIFGLSPFLIERYRRLAHDFYLANRKLAVRRAIWGVALTAIGTLGYYVAYAYIAWRTVSGQFTVGDLTFLAGSFMRLRGLFEGSLFRFSNLAGQALYLEDLFGFFRIVPRVVSPANPLRFPVPIREGFRFENTGFRYPGAERWAVRHLDFTLRAGEVLALVGENGAGKTTLVKLLTRLYDPTEGRILLDGHDLREYDLAEVRANMGVIFQDFVRYHLLASENIAVGRIDALDDRARIESAAQRSLADAVIQKLPDGYNQLIGRRFKSGVDLSVGEWQKIAIARAYMREAQVLILDEPTASLDARAEFEVFQRFKELSRGRTAVLISHRFSSVRMAERILVLDGGQIEASGTHEELLAQRGRYAELFELQAAGYR